jgi:hypothetical protein
VSPALAGLLSLLRAGAAAAESGTERVRVVSAAR